MLRNRKEIYRKNKYRYSRQCLSLTLAPCLIR